MNPIKIFDMKYVYEYIDYETGLISVDSIFYVLSYKYWNAIPDIIDTYVIYDETFEMVMNVASKLIGTAKNNIVMYDSSALGSGWRIHPILVKSVLRHIESVFPYKTILANVIYSKEPKKGIDTIKSCSLLSIVSNVQYQTCIRGRGKDHKEYKCNGVSNKDDMFNDDILICKCVEQIIIKTLMLLMPLCICDIVVSYFNL
jgi:hypothetical protein